MESQRSNALDDVMTAQQAADYLGMSLEGTYKAIQRGTLTARKLGGKLYIVERTDVESYKAARERIKRRRAV